MLTSHRDIALYLTIGLSCVFIILLGCVSGRMFHLPGSRIAVGVTRQLILVAVACAVVILVNYAVGKFV